MVNSKTLFLEIHKIEVCLIISKSILKNMGWYTNYEIEFEDHIDWDDSDVKRKLQRFTAEHLYLRDLNKPRVILSVYSHSTIEDILVELKALYSTGIRYRAYDSSEAWITFCLAN